MRRSIVVPGKNVMADLMLVLREAEIKSEAIPVHMHQGQTTKTIQKIRVKHP